MCVGGCGFWPNRSLLAMAPYFLLKTHQDVTFLSFFHAEFFALSALTALDVAASSGDETDENAKKMEAVPEIEEMSRKELTAYVAERIMEKIKKKYPATDSQKEKRNLELVDLLSKSFVPVCPGSLLWPVELSYRTVTQSMNIR